MYYLKKGVFYSTRASLALHLEEKDLTVMGVGERYVPEDYYRAFELLLTWCQSVLAAL